MIYGLIIAVILVTTVGSSPYRFEGFFITWAVFSLMIWAIQSSSEN